MSEELSKEAKIKIAENDLTEALEKWLRLQDLLEDDYMMVNWLFVASTVDMKGEDWTGVTWGASSNTAFWQQGGLLNYANSRFQNRVQCGHETEEEANRDDQD